jgi:hypothetical protein
VNQIERNGKIRISRIEIQNVVGSPSGNAVEEFFSQVSVRINYTDAISPLDVLTDQISKQRCLSSSSFSYRVKMLPAIRARNTERRFASPNSALSDVSGLIIHVPNRIPTPASHDIEDDDDIRYVDEPSG